MNLKLRFFSMVVIAIGLNQVNIAYAQQYDQPINDKKKLLSSKLAVEKYPDSAQRHKAYLDNMGILNPDVTKQYDIWIKNSPNLHSCPLLSETH